MDLTVVDDPAESVERSAADRRSLLARLGGAAGIASVAGCTSLIDSDMGGGSPDEDSEADDSTGDADGVEDDADVDVTDHTDTEQRIVDLRAILKGFEDAYDQSVLDRAGAVRQQFRESVVFVDLESEPVAHRLATGWFVGDGQVVTGDRKLGTLQSVQVHTIDGNPHEARVVRTHEDENLALLELDASRPPIQRSTAIPTPPKPNQPLVQIGHHDEYGHWVATVGDFTRTQTFGDRDELIDEHWSNVPGLPGVGGAPVFTLDGGFVGMTNGAVPRNRGKSAPEPLNDYVYDWQMSHREWLNHLDAEQLFAEIDPWL